MRQVFRRIEIKAHERSNLEIIEYNDRTASASVDCMWTGWVDQYPKFSDDIIKDQESKITKRISAYKKWEGDYNPTKFLKHLLEEIRKSRQLSL
jgi:hypothetical protein